MRSDPGSGRQDRQFVKKSHGERREKLFLGVLQSWFQEEKTSGNRNGHKKKAKRN